MKVKENIQLSKFTTLGTGGPARWFAEPESVEDVAREQDETGGDVDHVVDRVDLEAEEQVTLDAVTGVEARIRDEAEDAGEE